MGAAAQLDGFIIGIDHPDSIAVLFAKEGHSAHLLGLLNGHLGGGDGIGFQDELIDAGLHLGQLLGSHRGEVAEIEAADLIIHQGTGLMDMIAQDLLQCLLQQVAGGVVAHDAHAAVFIHGGGDGIAHLEGAVGNGADMNEVAGAGFAGIGDGKDILAAGDGAAIAHLAAHFGIEGGAGENDLGGIALTDGFDPLALIDDTEDLAFGGQTLVADEVLAALNALEDILDPGHIADIAGSGLTGGGALLFHQGLVALLIHGDTALLAQLTGQIDGEAEGIIQAEGILAGEDGLALGGQLFQDGIDLIEAGINGAGKALLLHTDGLYDIVPALDELRIGALIFVDDGIGDLIQERLADAKETAMTGGTAQQAAQHIAAALILRDNAVADHKDGGADVVGDHTDGNILFLILLVGDAGDLADLLHDVLDGIDLKEVIDALHDAGQALQAHAGIDVLVLQGGVMTLAVGIELGEYQVPELNIAVAVTADMAIGTAAALFGPAVKVDLGAGAAGAGADLPEVILFAQTDHVVGGDAAALGPDIIGLVIILVNRDIELIDGQLQLLGDELPGPAGSVLLEVIAEGEVAQHLEVGAVAGGLAYIFDIRGTDALLAAGGAEAAVRQELLPGEVFLEGGHAGIDEQEAGLILRHQRRRGQAGVPLTDKEFEEGFAQFIESCPFHSGLIPFFW